MFDDLNKENKEEKPNSIDPKKNEVEDIFSESKNTQESKGSTEQGGLENKNEQQVRADNEDVVDEFGINSMEIEQQNKRKLIVLMLMFIGIIVIGWGTYFLFGKIVKNIGGFEEPVNEVSNPMNEVEDNIPSKEEEPEPVKEVDETEDIGDIDALEEEVEEVLDTDKDGLSDEEEIALGLNIESVDTDSDGLFDREEVKIYKTDALNPDTDGDGFLDGEEVKAGYNPKGSGRILKINKVQ